MNDIEEKRLSPTCSNCKSYIDYFEKKWKKKLIAEFIEKLGSALKNQNSLFSEIEQLKKEYEARQ